MENFLICGDLVPTRSNYGLFITPNIDELIGEELSSLLKDANYVFANLETPLCECEMAIDKCGPNLKASVATVAGIKAMGNIKLSLSNNHIMDFGRRGLKETITTLKAENIEFFGAGFSVQEAKKEYVFTINNKKICIYSCCEHEFSLVTEFGCGANPFDIIETFDYIRELKKKYDFVIVLYHGGKEHYRYPSPNLQRSCRRLIEKGADLVVCQHSHCIGCREDYGNGVIVYGQGNFIFDLDDNEFWNTSILLNVSIIDEKLIVSEIPIVKNRNKIRIANDIEKHRILGEYYERSKKIYDSNFLNNNYDNFALEMVENYLIAMLGNRLFVRILRRIFGKKAMSLFFRRDDLLRIRNYIECEAHLELFTAGIKKLSKRNG